MGVGEGTGLCVVGLLLQPEPSRFSQTESGPVLRPTLGCVDTERRREKNRREEVQGQERWPSEGSNVSACFSLFFPSSYVTLLLWGRQPPTSDPPPSHPPQLILPAGVAGGQRTQANHAQRHLCSSTQLLFLTTPPAVMITPAWWQLCSYIRIVLINISRAAGDLISRLARCFSLS